MRREPSGSHGRLLPLPFFPPFWRLWFVMNSLSLTEHVPGARRCPRPRAPRGVCQTARVALGPALFSTTWPVLAGLPLAEFKKNCSDPG